jgi:hypothetical protein
MAQMYHSADLATMGSAGRRFARRFDWVHIARQQEVAYLATAEPTDPSTRPVSTRGSASTTPGMSRGRWQRLRTTHDAVLRSADPPVAARELKAAGKG